MRIHFLVPAVNVGGGIREVIGFANGLCERGAQANIVSLWHSAHQMRSPVPIHELTNFPATRRWAMPSAIIVFTLLVIFLVRKGLPRDSNDVFVFTHYMTVPFSFFVKRDRRLFFVQDLEWRFLGNGVLSRLWRRVLLHFYKRGTIISANEYLTKSLIAVDISVKYDLRIWANPNFQSTAAQAVSEDRPLDFVMVLRRGKAKRLDLYLKLIDLCAIRSNIKIAVISPDEELIELLREKASQCLLRPSSDEMRNVYAKSKVFLMLSEHEGFGLPPLEAMGSGCVPICRDSGGVRAYMKGDELERLVLPLDMPIEDLFEFAIKLVSNNSKLEKARLKAVEQFSIGIERAQMRNLEMDRLMNHLTSLQ